MQFKRIGPKDELNNLIECYWIVENEDPAPLMQKIIPDGFPEIIFHFADPYAIKLSGRWKVQPKNLVAGQITSHFFLKNTGRSSILGIKCKPAAFTHLFNISMHKLTNQVVELKGTLSGKLDGLANTLRSTDNHLQRIDIIGDQLTKMVPRVLAEMPIEKAIAVIFATKGMTSVAHICQAAGTTERQLERLFRKYIGLSPKFYARIIRFSYIFQVVQKKEMNGSALGLESGFYDQSHFIKNFKAFTGEDPSRYFFDQPNLANFFLKKE
jgi:AraC-like DNA-binding protein